MGDLDDCQILLEKVETIFHEELETEETGRTDMKYFFKAFSNDIISHQNFFIIINIFN